ncbi:MAG: glycosyltransferase family 2 protein [Planctomycetales bacterium]|nr:glycosyltransferase family 2 protein [Planctomycetales bacterium]
MMYVSVVIPIFNERPNIRPLYLELKNTLSLAHVDCEILFVDDGSTDGTHRELMSLIESDGAVRLISFRRNFGQTAAMQAGIEQANGDVIVTIDGDLQNDPRDIPVMLEKLAEGFDVVHGWRRQRHDAWLTRKLPSRIANWLIRHTTKFPVHDLGCTLKVMRTDIARELNLYGEMHRFIPILAAQRGARCAEVITNHRPRRFGDSKYGLSRTVRVILDLMTVKYLQNYFANPMKLFGVLGLGACAASACSLCATVAMKWFSSVDMTGNPLLLLSAFSVLAGIQLFGLGLLGEVLARIYYDANERRPFAIAYDSATMTVRQPLKQVA